MEPKFKNTFSVDSKSAASQQSQAYPTFSNKQDFRIIASIVLLVLSVLAAAGMFLASRFYYDNRISAMENSIIEQRDALLSEQTQKLHALSKQVTVLKNLDAVRTGYLKLVSEVSRIVVPDVRYSSVDISLTEENEYKVEIRGVTQSLRSYLEQVRVLTSAGGIFNRVNLTDYSITASEGVTTVSFDLVVVIPVSELHSIL